jgi:hypothetical protein
VYGGWRKLYNEEFHSLLSSPSTIRKIKEDAMGRLCSTHGYNKITYRILVGKPDGKRPLGRPRCRWEDNTKMDLRETGLD